MLYRRELPVVLSLVPLYGEPPLFFLAKSQLPLPLELLLLLQALYPLVLFKVTHGSTRGANIGWDSEVGGGRSLVNNHQCALHCKLSCVVRPGFDARPHPPGGYLKQFPSV